MNFSHVSQFSLPFSRVDIEIDQLRGDGDKEVEVGEGPSWEPLSIAIRDSLNKGILVDRAIVDIDPYIRAITAPVGPIGGDSVETKVTPLSSISIVSPATTLLSF